VPACENEARARADGHVVINQRKPRHDISAVKASPSSSLNNERPKAKANWLSSIATPKSNRSVSGPKALFWRGGHLALNKARASKRSTAPADGLLARP
jgi:hypothetical protein